jgi:predicted nucleotidyltransferase component of viral defense system
MISDVFLEKIKEYQINNEIEQENILLELIQQFILVSLAKANFFVDAQFHGGTCLKIIHNYKRFSEDLDFVLKNKKPDFILDTYLEQVRNDFLAEGIHIEVIDKSVSGKALKKAFLKTNSLGKMLMVDLPFTRDQRKKLKVKLEVDTNPPTGSTYETAYLNFPTIMPITVQTLESCFSGKSHALLCRNYIKGRDWYDFIWYVNKKICLNYTLLESALFQEGPFKGKKLKVTISWLKKEMEKKIKSIDWNKTKEDVYRFLPLDEQKTLELWNVDFFLYYLKKFIDECCLEKKTNK